MTTDANVKTGEIVPYELAVDGSTITEADWAVSTGAAITGQVDLSASSTVLVSFPVAGKYKLIGTMSLANGAKLVGVMNIIVSNP
jgi:hypothetical protein